MQRYNEITKGPVFLKHGVYFMNVQVSALICCLSVASNEYCAYPKAYTGSGVRLVTSNKERSVLMAEHY